MDGGGPRESVLWWTAHETRMDWGGRAVALAPLCLASQSSFVLKPDSLISFQVRQ